MKNIYHILIVLLLVSCTSNEPENTVSNQSSESSDKARIENLKKSISGIWLPIKYVDEITSNKSAYKSHHAIPDVAEMQIDPFTESSDTINVSSSLNNHEGYGFKLWFENVDGKIEIKTDARRWEKDQFETSLSVNIADDTTLTIKSIDRNTGEAINIIDYTRVRKISNKSNFGGMAYDYIARKTILNGRYEVINLENSLIDTIEFDSENGVISNFKYKHYSIITDYGGPFYESDHVQIFIDKEDYKTSKMLSLVNQGDTTYMCTSEEFFENDIYGFKLKDTLYSLVNL